MMKSRLHANEKINVQSFALSSLLVQYLNIPQTKSPRNVSRVEIPEHQSLNLVHIDTRSLEEVSLVASHPSSSEILRLALVGVDASRQLLGFFRSAFR
jgi:hypothetical protein